MKYKRYLFFANSGTLVVNFFMTFIPTFIIVLLITGKTIALGWNLLFFFIAGILSIIMSIAM